MSVSNAFGGSRNRSRSTSKETALSTEQANILKQSRGEYLKYWMPELYTDIQETKGSGQTAKLAQVGIENVNNAYASAKQEVGRDLAQREITGGMRGLADIKMNAARAGAVSGVMNDAYAKKKEMRSSLIGLAMSMSPKPTQAAPVGQRSSSSGGSFNHSHSASFM